MRVAEPGPVVLKAGTMKIAFALLAHQHPHLVARLAGNLAEAGFTVAIHYDEKAPLAEFQYLVDAFRASPAVRLTRRIDVRWGMWSVVDATLICLDEIHTAGWEPDYVYHASGSDYPIRSARELTEFLNRNQGQEFIESISATSQRWVKGGPQQERYQYQFLFNWREQKLLFDGSLIVQKKLFRPRRFARDMEPYIGSQWWVLTWATLQKIRELARQPDIRKFFRTTLIPDELFFQTLVRHLVPDTSISPRALTLNRLTDYGIPTVFYADHVSHLAEQPFFMARKISPYNTAIHDALDSYWRGERAAAPKSDGDYGRVSSDYERHRLAYRDGPPGKPLVGRKPDRRSGDLERLEIPFFVVLGTSTLQLRLAHDALPINNRILFHRQLFHSKCIEFAPAVAACGGYRTGDIALRAISPADFLSDVVRSERQRLSGFLLRWGQGQRMTEVLFERPNARMVVIPGDLLLSFIENVLGIEPTLEESTEIPVLDAIAPAALVVRFRAFVEEFTRHRDWLAHRIKSATAAKPAGSMAVIDLRLAPVALNREVINSRSRDLVDVFASLRWPELVGTNAVNLAIGQQKSAVETNMIAPEIAALQECCDRVRGIVMERLGAGGLAAAIAEDIRIKAEAWPGR